MNRVIALFCLAFVTACNASDDDSETPMSQDEVSAQVDTVKLSPGQWDASQLILDAQIQGLPAGAPADAATKLIGERTELDHCVTPEQARNPSADLFGGMPGMDCTFSRMKMELGKIDAKLQCRSPDKDQDVTITIWGEYQSDRYDLDVDTAITGMPNGLSLKTKAKTRGKWVGEECLEPAA